ncbi:MAG: ABC transporter ATP-binding protein [Cyclobacteriaceae bacterium]
MIQVNKLSKSFSRLKVLDEISMEITKGGIYAILGPNGSGKTTFLKILLGMVLPDSGEIHYNEKNILKSHEYRSNLGYLPQIARFPDNLSVKEIVAMIADVRNVPSEPDLLIKWFGLESFMDKKLGNLSGGTRQKVNIVLTFMFDSPVIVLDEPTAGLDPVSLIKLKELINKEKAKGKIILITSHIMSLVEELADEVFFLLEGNIYFNGTIAELRSQTQTEDLEHAIASILAP